jgi:hypothetical protein
VGGCRRSLECLEQSATMPDESVLLDLRQDDTVRRGSAALRQLDPPDTQSGRGRRGVRVSEQWSLVSGCELADWIPVMSVLTKGTETRMRAPGVPESRMAYVPKGRLSHRGHLVRWVAAGHWQPRCGGGQRVRACGEKLLVDGPGSTRSAPVADAVVCHHGGGVRCHLSGDRASGHRHPAAAERLQDVAVSAAAVDAARLLL